MKCLVCQETNGRHKMSCRSSEREAAARWTSRKSTARAELHKGSTPYGEAPTRGAMLAKLDAFCARYAAALEQDAREMRDVDAAQALWDKAAQVWALMVPKIGGMYS